MSLLGNLFGSKRRKRRRQEAEQEAAEIRMQRAEEERKSKQERVRAGKIRLNALRSRRSSSFFAEAGRDTIG